MTAIDRARTSPRQAARSFRRGLTLFELLLALAIFLASLAALAQLLASGSRAAAQSRLQTEAILRCESKMGELVAGIEPIKTRSTGVFGDDPRWSWQWTVTDAPWPNLQLVELRVTHAGQSSLGNSSYMLRRYVRDPRLFVEAAPRPVAAFPSAARRRRGNRSATRSETGASGARDSGDSDG